MADFIAEIDPKELAVRMIEAGHGVKRPPDYTPEQALDRLDPDALASLMRMGEAAAAYFAECLSRAHRVDP